MITGLIPQRYARALFKYALESDSTVAVYEEMKRVIAAYRENPQLGKVLANPFIAEKEKRRLMLAAAGPDTEECYERFVSLVLEHNREDMFQLMSLAFRDEFRKANNISQACITTAVKLSDDEMERLRNLVSKSYRDTKFEYSYKVDPAIIGGFIIDVDSTRLDASINGELEQLRQNLITGN